MLGTHRGHTGTIDKSSDQQQPDLARTPVRLVFRRHDQRLDPHRQLIGITNWMAGAMCQRLQSVTLIAIEDLVAGLARYVELPASLGHAFALQRLPHSAELRCSVRNLPLLYRAYLYHQSGLSLWSRVKIPRPKPAFNVGHARISATTSSIRSVHWNPLKSWDNRCDLYHPAHLGSSILPEAIDHVFEGTGGEHVEQLHIRVGIVADAVFRVAGNEDGRA